jgi:hypothetical protein
MATDAELMHQVLEPLAIGETADQTLVNTFDFDPTGTAFKFTLSSRPGRTPALVLTTGDAEIELTVTGPVLSVYTATITIHYVTADTEDLNPGDYHFDLWDTDNDARVAAGTQPVVRSARLEVAP